MTRLKPVQNYFNLIELLAVFSVLMVLISLLSPAMKRMIDSSLRLSCLNQQRQIGQIIHIYADENGFAPTRESSSWRIVPYLYHIESMYNPLSDLGLEKEMLACPANPERSPGHSYPTISQHPITKEKHYFSNYVYLAGLREDCEDLVKSGWKNYFYDQEPTAAHRHLEEAPRKVMLADLNFWATWYGGVLMTNHGGGLILGELDLAPQLILGGNRIYADGGGEWIDAYEMGANNGPVSIEPKKARFSHTFAGNRPYWW